MPATTGVNRSVGPTADRQRSASAADFERGPLMTKDSAMQRRLLPSLEEIIFAVTLLFLFLFGQGGSVLLGDSDTGWHIRTGQWILQHLAVPRQDLFSFSKPGGEWFAWEWLSDVLFALAHRYAGLAGVVLLAGLLIALTY